MDRLEKLEWLRESTTLQFQNEILVNEMVRWMGQKDFNEFFEHLCNHWDIKTPEELMEAEAS
tara:strand:- start:296 stop:481 length:186 start_codon:yes stop_codon:yes gene_type:complete